MPEIEENGVRLHYDEYGEGPPVILVHGLACGRRMWWRQRMSFAGRYRVVMPDLPGHGLSETPDDPRAYAEDVFADDLIALLDRLGIGKAAFVGFSMGAGISLNLAVRHPERVSALVLVGVGSGSENPWTLARTADEWVRVLRRNGLADFARKLMRSALFRHYARQHPHGRKHIHRLIRQHSPKGLDAVLMHLLARRKPVYRRGHALGRMRMPALTLLGQLDWPCRKSTRFVAAGIPGATLVEFEGVGHFVPLEAPAEFDAAVLDFLDRALKTKAA